MEVLPSLAAGSLTAQPFPEAQFASSLLEWHRQRGEAADRPFEK
ncbi:MAG: hypothetical protein QOI71_590, partial [Gaiellales bacterium]|nr:hypothetical protein [Gaiellales bacterium]